MRSKRMKSLFGRGASLEFFENHVGAFFEQELIILVQEHQT